MTKEDFSYWKYVRKCRRCKKKFGSDDRKLKQRCWECTYGIKAQLADKLPSKPRRKLQDKLKADKYSSIHYKPKIHGWQWS